MTINKFFGYNKARLKIVTRERGEINASQVRDLDKIAAEVDEKAKIKAIGNEYINNLFIAQCSLFLNHIRMLYICILVEGQEIMKEESSIIPTYDAITTDP